MDAWGSGRREHVDNHALHSELSERLRLLDQLLPQLSAGEREALERGKEPEVSSRELTMARSRTALSCKLHARQQQPAAAASSAASSSAAASSSSAAAPVAARAFGELEPELLEIVLSFVATPAELARCGAVCTEWYLASRMHSLWVTMLRRSGRLGVAASPSAPLALPHEDECTLFETAARIERHGCRPLDGACQPARGTIDSHVDDLRAYQVRPPARLAPPRPARSPDAPPAPPSSSSSSSRRPASRSPSRSALRATLRSTARATRRTATR